MANEDELPTKLRKLEITHSLPHIKLLDTDLPVELNPFFEFELKAIKPENKVQQKLNTQIKLVEHKTTSHKFARCRFRRASESGISGLQHDYANSLSDSDECKRTPTGGVRKQTLKKSTSDRKVILREPILKALQTCLHPHTNVRRSLLASAANTKLSANNDTTLSAKGVSDFRDLVDECRNILLEDVDFSGRLNKLCLSNRNSKSFTTMQNPKIQSNKSCSNKNQFNSHEMPSIDPQLTSSSSSSTVQQRNGVSSPEQLTNQVRSNTSCSQQAGNSAAAATCDDVTIDELACYFDTFVHIPKKMSSMAEMMYI